MRSCRFMGARLSGYPKDSQVNQLLQRTSTAIAYDRLLAAECFNLQYYITIFGIL